MEYYFERKFFQLLGLGIDEATALVVRGDTMEVVGKGNVSVYDRRQAVKTGGPDHELLPPGTRYEMKARKKIQAPAS